MDAKEENTSSVKKDPSYPANSHENITIKIEIEPIHEDVFKPATENPAKNKRKPKKKLSKCPSPVTAVSKQPFACSFCEYKAIHPSILKRHLLKHSKEKAYQCEVCNKKFMHDKSLKLHMLKHDEEGMIKCPHCPFETVHRISIKQHVLVHTGEKPFACDICDFKTAYAYALKGHLRTHTGDKPYKCDKCDYKTAYQGHLRKHLIRHAGLKPHKCDICDFQCMHLRTLKEHIYKHTGEKPFECNQCSFKTHLSEGLKEHIRTHTGEKPYACDKCDYKCARKNGIKKHRKIHTKVKGVGSQSIKLIDPPDLNHINACIPTKPKETTFEVNKSIHPSNSCSDKQMYSANEKCENDTNHTHESEQTLITEIKIEPHENFTESSVLEETAQIQIDVKPIECKVESEYY